MDLKQLIEDLTEIKRLYGNISVWVDGLDQPLVKVETDRFNNYCILRSDK